MSIDTPSGLYCQLSQQSPIPVEIDCHCHNGSLLAVVGPSGSGKSTLLRMLAGLSTPEAGLIQCNGQVWCDLSQQINLSPAARHVGYVPQHFGLFPHLTALDNVLAGLDHLPKQARRAQAQHWLTKMHLSQLASRLPRHLSGGQQQRVALARALAREPKLLLLDEPFSAVDWATRESLYEILIDLKTNLAIPVVLVTHDLKEAQLLADQMLLMENGRMLQQGSPQQILYQPQTPSVAKQMGQRNIFTALVASSMATETSQLLWAGAPLNIAYRADLTAGSEVRWMINNSGICLYTDLNAKQQNPFVARIDSLVSIGERVRCRATLKANQQVLQLELAASLAEQLGLKQGVERLLVLNPQAIHIFNSN